MKHGTIVAAMAAALAISPAASAQPYGMMGGGMGPGMMGDGYGMGMMGGQGMGMMGGQGMGMMGGQGMGMMGDCGPGVFGLDLTAEQRQKLSDIRRDVFSKRWQLMEKMHGPDGPMAQAWAGGEYDEKAARQAYDQMAQAHREMFEAQLEARKRMESVLTPEQREQLERGYGGRGPRR